MQVPTGPRSQAAATTHPTGSGASVPPLPGPWMDGDRARGAPSLLPMRSPRIAALFLVLAAALVAPASPVAALEPKWPDAEAFAKTLIDCNRGGGWVNEDGTCDTEDADKRVPKREPLKLGKKLSDLVARPYSRKLANAGTLSHYLGGSIQQRFDRVGLGGGRVGENIGYAGGREDVLAGVLRVHLLFQEEWSSNGWHWRNLMDKRFTRVGVGVWVRDGRTYLVLDFHS